MNLSELEKYVTSQARRYSRGRLEVKDLEQIGRIAIWQKLEKEPNAPQKHLLAASKQSMINYIIAWERPKIKPKEGLISLGNFYETESTSTHQDELLFDNELVLFMKNSLREKFGRKYCEGIKKLSSPKKIVKNIIRTTIEDIAEISMDEIPSRVNWQFFKDNKLEWLLWTFYNNSPATAIMDAYKGEFVPWNFYGVPVGYWKGKVGDKRTSKAMKWFCEKKNIASEKDCRNIRCKDFMEEGLGWMLQYKFKNSPYLALKTMFPDLKLGNKKYIRNEDTFNTLEKRRLIVVDYLEELGVGDISGMTPEQVYNTSFRERVTAVGLRKRFSGLLKRYYDFNPYLMFKELFPEQIHPWFLKGNQYIWYDNPKKIASDAVKWLFESYLKIPVSEIPAYATQEFFKEVGFGGMLNNTKLNFNCSPYLMVDNAYPRVFTKEDFNRSRKTNNYILKTFTTS